MDADTMAATFPTEVSGLPLAGRPAVVEVDDGGVLDLRLCGCSRTTGRSRVRPYGSAGAIHDHRTTARPEAMAR